MSRLLLSFRRTLFFAVALLPGIASAAAPAVGESSEPIHIEANRMISQENDNSVVFIGNVDAKQGNLTIRSDEMTVFYTEAPTGGKGKQGSSQMEKLICKKNVKIIQGDWLGTGDRMDDFAKERKVILSGNAKAWQGQNMVAGKTITYYLNDKRSIVEPEEGGKGGRVKAVIHPDEKK